MNHTIKVTHRVVETAEGIFVDETIEGKKGLVRYGPVPDVETADAFRDARVREIRATAYRAMENLRARLDRWPFPP